MPPPDEGLPCLQTMALAGFFLAIALIVYLPSFGGQFLLDDGHSIVENTSIRRLWPLYDIFSTKGNTGVAGRPILNLSLAITYQISGLSVWGYHAFNLTFHVLAALTLFGIVRRALLTKKMQPMFGGRANGIALATGLIWMVHPLQTASVTYIIQRAESLMGLLYLLTLYCAIRGFTSPRYVWWNGAAVAFCALGMGTKEVMVGAPLVVLAYDRIFRSESFKEALRGSPALYSGLAGTWLVLGGLLATHSKSESVGFQFKGITPLGYLLAQSEIILHYLGLSFWPTSLCFYYTWPIPKSFLAVVPSAFPILIILGASIWAFWRGSPSGFVGVWFFLILAPSSSILPIVTEIAAEHRMYLPLASVLVLTIVVGDNLVRNCMRKWFVPQRMPKQALLYAHGVIVGVVVAMLGYQSFQRNKVYQDPIVLWEDTLSKQPQNDRAHANLGYYLAKIGKNKEAMAHYYEALKFNPNSSEVHFNLANHLASEGNADDAIAHYSEAVRISPDNVKARLNLGTLLASKGDYDSAITQFREALKTEPVNPDALYGLGRALACQGQHREAIKYLEESLRLNPSLGEAHNQLGMLLVLDGRADEAVSHFREALRSEPRNPAIHFYLGSALESRGQSEEAIAHLQEAIQIKPTFAEAHSNLGAILSRQGRMEEAIAHLEEAVRLNPEFAPAHYNLKAALDARRTSHTVHNRQPQD